jgi:hypothetical protein
MIARRRATPERLSAFSDRVFAVPLFSFEFVLINVLVDVLYAVVNPEVRLQ